MVTCSSYENTIITDDCMLTMCLFSTNSGGSSYQCLEEIVFDEPQSQPSEGIRISGSPLCGGH